MRIQTKEDAGVSATSSGASFLTANDYRWVLVGMTALEVDAAFCVKEPCHVEPGRGSVGTEGSLHWQVQVDALSTAWVGPTLAQAINIQQYLCLFRKCVLQA